MNVYIATKLDNVKNHNLLRDALAEKGVRLSYDWTQPGAQDLPRDELAWYEWSGVKYADVVVVLLPGGRSTHVEFGAALAFGKPVVAYGEVDQVWGTKRPIVTDGKSSGGASIFFALDGRFDSWFRENEYNAHDISRISTLDEPFEKTLDWIVYVVMQRLGDVCDRADDGESVV